MGENISVNTFLIDYSIGTKSGMHEQLEKATIRNIVFPAYRFKSTYMLNFLLKLQQFPIFPFILSSQLFGRWKYYLRGESINKVVVIANYQTVNIVKWINKKYPEIRVHVYYFNIISKDVPISYFQKLNCDIWTFDFKDAKAYNISQINFPLPMENFSNLPSINKFKYDAIFVGADKGRLQEILSIKKILENNSLVINFHIVATLGEEMVNKYPYSKTLSYEKILKITNNSKTIVDIVQNGQTGGTIRSIEAMFLKKKLITNNLSVIDEPYYDNRNIFIIGKDDEKQLHSFVSTPYQHTNYNVQQHELNNWLKYF